MLASSTVPTLPSTRTGATPKLLNVVVVQVFGRGDVVVLGPFRDKITSSQFHLGCWGWAAATKNATKMTKIDKTFIMNYLQNFLRHIIKFYFSFWLCCMSNQMRVSFDTLWNASKSANNTKKILDLFAWQILIVTLITFLTKLTQFRLVRRDVFLTQFPSFEGFLLPVVQPTNPKNNASRPDRWSLFICAYKNVPTNFWNQSNMWNTDTIRSLVKIDWVTFLYTSIWMHRSAYILLKLTTNV